VRLKESVYLTVCVALGVFPIKIFFVFDLLLGWHLRRFELVDDHGPRGSSTFDLLEIEVEFLPARDLLALPVRCGRIYSIICSTD
jgi:hypothetical protein